MAEIRDLGSTVSSGWLTNEELDAKKQNINHVLEKTIVHLGTCAIGLECFLTYAGREGDLYIFKSDCSGFCPWGKDEILFVHEDRVYARCAIDENCVCYGKGTFEYKNGRREDHGNRNWHRVQLQWEGGEDTPYATIVHQFDGFDGINIAYLGITVEFMKDLLEKSRKVITDPVLTPYDRERPFENGAELWEQSPKVHQVYMCDCEVNNFEFVRDF